MKILTAEGFKKFDGWVCRDPATIHRIEFSDDSYLRCTRDHKILLKNGNFVACAQLKPGEITFGGLVIENIIEEEHKEHVYDALNVQDTHSYYTNNVISHNCVFCDEFSFVNKAEVFYTSTFPVISSGTDSKFIISSTPNGVGNMFYKLWEGAVQGTNEYKPFRIRWQDVPGRDEKWKAQTIANTSERQFRQEHDCQFLGSAATLIDSDTLLGLKAKEPIKVWKDISYYIEPEPNHSYIMTVDVSRGRGQDYSTCSVYDVTDKTFFLVATYRSNMISPLLFPEYVVRLAKTYNNALVIIENNDSGEVVCNAVYYEYEYENTFVSSSVKSGGIGVRMTKRVKRIGCSNLKDLIESGRLQVYDANLIQELCAFEPHGDSFAARGNNHDDLVMNAVLFSWFVSSDLFASYSNHVLTDLLYAEHVKEIEDDVMPFGFINNHTNDTSPSFAAHQRMVDELREWNSL